MALSRQHDSILRTGARARRITIVGALSIAALMGGAGSAAAAEACGAGTTWNETFQACTETVPESPNEANAGANDPAVDVERGTATLAVGATRVPREQAPTEAAVSTGGGTGAAQGFSTANGDIRLAAGATLPLTGMSSMGVLALGLALLMAGFLAIQDARRVQRGAVG